MKNPHMPIQAPDASMLSTLLILARKLLQSDDAQDSLALIGRALADMTAPDAVLLLLRGERLQIVGFDKRGTRVDADKTHALYRTGTDMMRTVDAHTTDKMPFNGWNQPADARTLVLALPAQASTVILVAAWDHDLLPVERDRYGTTLPTILELAGAAMGKIETRNALERLVWGQREQMTSTAMVHATQLVRRNEEAVELRMLSLTDVLTGLYNRRGFFLQAEHSLKLARRKHAKSAVIYADIDGLKRINDKLGHDAGDRLIRDAGEIFLQSFRQADVVSRLGGDEFVAYTLDDEQPDVIVERICANLHAFNLMQDRPYAIAMSAGIVQCDPKGDRTLSDYVGMADKRMYAQKRGRMH